MFARSTEMGNTRASVCGNEQPERLSRFFYINQSNANERVRRHPLFEMTDNSFSTVAGVKSRRCTCSLYMTERCNLNCVYCYEHIKSDRCLSEDIARDAIIQTFDRAVEEGMEYVEILFHGGEPFLAFERIKAICDWVWSQEWPCKYVCYATTNGTLVHGEIKKWLYDNRHRFIAGLSLDGTREMHNRNRSGSYDHIDIGFFRDTWPTQGVKMTPSPGTIDTLAEGVIHIHELGFTRNNCSFASGVDWSRDDKGQPVDYKKILSEQFDRLARYYLEHPDVMPVDMLNIRFMAIAAGRKAMKSKLCGAGTIMRCWTPDGRCLPCHLFYESCKEGNGDIPQFDFDNVDNLSDPRCEGCILEPACPTCYGGNYISAGDIRIRDMHTCEIMKLRALAGSWMIGRMLEAPHKYVALSGLSDMQLAMTVKGVLAIQRMFD